LSSGRNRKELTGVEMKQDHATRVLIVDDHELFRTGLRTLLEEEGFEVADAGGGAEAARRARGFMPDVVVMDMNMPEMTGVEATPIVLEAAPQTSVLMLTIATDDKRVLDAVRAGASGYLLKDAPLEEITAGVKAAAAGLSAIAPRIAGALLSSVRATAVAEPERDEAPTPVALSARERDVLVLLADGCDNTKIASRLYLSPSTVKNHVSRLLDKLGVDNRVQAATFALRNGLIRLD
jgi:two-component system, NarL family, response regulator LiaR